MLRRIRPTLDEPRFFSVRDHEADDFQPEACRHLKVQGRIDEGELIATVSEFVRQKEMSLGAPQSVRPSVVRSLLLTSRSEGGTQPVSELSAR